MVKSWLPPVARLALFVGNTLMLGAIYLANSGFDALWGLMAGVVLFLALVAWLHRQGGLGFSLRDLRGPFWPMRSYPRAYWGTLGTSICLGSVINLGLGLGDTDAANFFAGTMLVGAGMLAAALWRQPQSR